MRRLRSSRPDERGSVALVVALCSIMLCGVTGLAVDIGMGRVVRADMQSTANTASLDMARALATGTKPATSAWTNALLTSINGDTTTLGHAASMPTSWNASDSVCNAKLCAQATPGYYDSNYDFTTTAPTGITSYDAVKVDATAQIGTTFGRAVGASSITAARSSVATALNNACFKIGSYAAGLKTNDGALAPLLGLLGTHSNLTVLGSDGIATTNTTAAHFLNAVATAGGTVTGVTGTATVRQILTAETTLLPSGGQAYLDLNKILSDNTAFLATPVDLSQLMNLTAGGPSALQTTLNLGDLLVGSIAVANGSNSVSLSGFATNLGLATISGGLYVTQKPQLACGPSGTTATTSQVGTGSSPLSITYQQSTLNALTSGVGSALSLAGLSVNVDGLTVGPTALSLNVASATGKLTNIKCSPDGISVALTNNSLLSASLTTTVTVAAHVSILGLGLINLVLPYTVAVTQQSDPSSPATTTIDLSNSANYDKAYNSGSGTLGLGGATVALDTANYQMTLAGVNVKNNILLGPLVTALLNGTNALVSNLTTSVASTLDAVVENDVVAPLGQMLGLTLPGAQIYAELPKPSCGFPEMIQ